MAELVKTRGADIKLQANRLSSENSVAVALWCGGVLVQEHDALNHDITHPGINVPTSMGMQRAQEGDWIIQRPPGDFITIPAHRFEELFEAVVDG